jgi:hypothetical protein
LNLITRFSPLAGFDHLEEAYCHTADCFRRI